MADALAVLDFFGLERVERFAIVWPRFRGRSRRSAARAALIPGALVETIPDCGHFPWVEQPEAFRTAVERLVDLGP